MTESSPSPDLKAQLRLRPDPKPVLRLSRKTLIIAGIVLGSVVGGALMLALAPTPKSDAKQVPEPSEVRASRSTERLNQLPKSYADIPALGPPLPGDLGKPMLKAGLYGPADYTGSAPLPGHDRAYPPATISHADTTDDQALKAAQNSSVFSRGSGATARGEGSTMLTTPEPTSIDFPGLTQSQDQISRSKAERQADFLGNASDKAVVSPERLEPPASPYLLQAGSVFSAALISAIRSDLPGQVTAQVTQDIYDSLGNGYLLVPQGSRLIGQYENAVAFGQSRVLLAWKRLILPNGKSIVLENLAAADVSGQAGLHDKTDEHWTGMLNAAALSTVLSIGSQAGSNDHDDQIVKALRDGASDSINRAGQRVVERQLTISPVLTIRPGSRVRVILSRDLILEP